MTGIERRPAQGLRARVLPEPRPRELRETGAALERGVVADGQRETALLAIDGSQGTLGPANPALDRTEHLVEARQRDEGRVP